MSKLTRELWRLTKLTKEQLPTLLDVAYGTIENWENVHMQPYPLRLTRIAVLDKPRNSLESSQQDMVKTSSSNIVQKRSLESERSRKSN
ncbi:hypothetical protein WA1_43350 [Scytonema hofmannii PCC 7110]|uniref:Uncharacterized protein n=1 Tax=Scytonema hofmannii PCC 7110 TaxID=128403 RepID=A0A139WVR8_9CYAN|nr:hypothetical protein WA1_43350 [Scytonema hofmannii PCC 7110]